MPVINFSYKDFCKLVGKKYSVKELEDTMPMMGMEWEGSSGDEISVELFPNRPDLLSVEGLARAYRAFRGLRVGLVNYDVKNSKYELMVDDNVSKVRPVISAVVVKGVKLTDETVKSLMQLQEKLHLTHCRNRAKAAIGVHDLRAVKFPVRYSAVEPESIKFIPLESAKELTPEQVLKQHPKGVKFAHLVNKFDAYPMVLNNDGAVLSFPPIINSELTKVRSSTRDLFIEVTGTDGSTVDKALNIVVTSLIERGAKAYKVKVHHGREVKVCPDFSYKVMELDAGYCCKLLGEAIPSRNLPAFLKRMGFDVERKDELLKVSIPCYRTDIMHPIDLVEDVAIAFGYENFEPLIPKVFGIGKEDVFNSRYEYVKNVFVGFGFVEVFNWLLTSREVLFDKMNDKSRKVVEVLQPKSEELAVCRDELIPLLIQFLSKNKHNDYPQNIFEVGDVLVYDKKVSQEKRFGVALAHPKSNYSELKSYLDTLFDELGVKVKVRDVVKPYFISGRAAELMVGNTVIGLIGEVHPQVLTNYDLKVPVTVCELNIEELVK